MRRSDRDPGVPSTVILTTPLGSSAVAASFVAPQSGSYQLWLGVSSPVTDRAARTLIYDAMQSVGREYQGSVDLGWSIESQGVRVVERSRIEKVYGTIQVGSGLGGPPIKAEGIVIDRCELVGGTTYWLTAVPGPSFAAVLPAGPTLVLEKWRAP